MFRFFENYSGMNDANFFLLPYKENLVFMRKNFLRFSCQDNQNDVNLPEKRFEKISGFMCERVRACVRLCQDLEKFKLLYLRNYSADGTEIWRALEAFAALSSILFSLKLILGLGFHDDLNFVKNVCNRSSCRKFKAIELNSCL